ncbi:TPA: Abi-alpha family protein [Vibrio parahaemolyticus]
MSSPENEVIKAVGKEVYIDSIQPLARHVGVVLGHVGKSLEILSYPLQGINWSVEESKKYLVRKLSKKLQGAEPTDLLTPNPYKLKTDLECYLSICDNETLREMFAELIAASFLNKHQQYAHPSHVAIMQQLAPFEARMLSQIEEVCPTLVLFDGYVDNYEDLAYEFNDPCYSLFANKLIDFKLIDDIYCREAEVAWNNLKRLQILEVSHTPGSEYDEVRAIDNEIIPAQFRTYNHVKIAISDLGYGFLECTGVIKDT